MEPAQRDFPRMQAHRMLTKEFVAVSDDAIEIVGVLLIVAGLVFAAGRWLFGRTLEPLAR